jgi:hypothetical protein
MYNYNFLTTSLMVQILNSLQNTHNRCCIYCTFHLVSSNNVDWSVRSLRDLRKYDSSYFYWLYDCWEQTSYRSTKQTHSIHVQLPQMA